jgi:hypothetical protein
VILGVAAFACLFAILALLLLLVQKLRPKKFRLKAVVTKWISVEVELESPEPMSRGLPSTRTGRQQEPAAAPLLSDDRDHPTATS